MAEAAERDVGDGHELGQACGGEVRGDLCCGDFGQTGQEGSGAGEGQLDEPGAAFLGAAADLASPLSVAMTGEAVAVTGGTDGCVSWAPRP